ncbi:betaine/proline/choline family ABC transporter ATP-binding protein [Rummeliibacillus sp. G93]|uniref:betaine/proline/choline family ABC transporter ATP-binding protein n=1 Tax=Rummeliibacillus TaxID=648802 RepID=UPI001166C051|nr:MULTISPECIES: betaine/proline/choline family ABC transporter ATP-binding protein [Rummeliibacillus]MBB5169147.1 osmoprotectant transport system ATP-binding protein [Rummeliibacillus stabekisii]MCM3316571.1 betaine/proline/choline family ABC transporter ATP-binding protein [Rummeliibacillus stabekisii]UQW96103.1 betaine/proline/choline family ABC transporter ATP-binding protein [Rummeliibacillus sp. G93]GEL03409.1 glycine/betaine ABC transporter ATP-binding protein [Rummeliibacillus stabekisi
MLKIEHLTKKYRGGKKAVNDLNLEIKEGEFIAFIGTSGSGKTTALRMINRMIEPSSGTITLNGKDLSKMNPVTLRRSIGYVIQQIGLMPHMTIRENITLVPKLLKWSKDKKDETAEKLIGLVNLPENYLDLYPVQLSGGQQQRIGVLRALAANQDIILMDEPFGALDPITRDTLQDLMKDLQQRLGKTVIFVTHDMDEAIKLADRICIMHNGEMVQFDTPDEILTHPANDFVKEFIGSHRLIQEKPSAKIVDDVMIKPVSITLEKSLDEAIKLMVSKRVDTLFVTDGHGRLLGYLNVEMITSARHTTQSIADTMNREVEFVKTGTKLQDSVRRILIRNLKNITVIDEEKRLIGLITRANIVDMVYDTIWGEENTEQ